MLWVSRECPIYLFIYALNLVWLVHTLTFPCLTHASGFLRVRTHLRAHFGWRCLGVRQRCQGAAWHRKHRRAHTRVLCTDHVINGVDAVGQLQIRGTGTYVAVAAVKFRCPMYPIQLASRVGFYLVLCDKSISCLTHSSLSIARCFQNTAVLLTHIVLDYYSTFWYSRQPKQPSEGAPLVGQGGGDDGSRPRALPRPHRVRGLVRLRR